MPTTACFEDKRRSRTSLSPLSKYDPVTSTPRCVAGAFWTDEFADRNPSYRV
jgi:hypothetical protein